MGRLYDETLQLKASIGELHVLIDHDHQSMIELRESIERDHLSIVELRASTNDLFRIASIHQQSLIDCEESQIQHQDVLRKHEKRHDRTEVTVEAILEDLRRHRENRPSA